MTVPSQEQVDLVRAYVAEHMNATVRIQRGERGTFDPATGRVGGLTNLSTVYEGKARIRNVTGAGVLNLAEADIATASTTISIPWGSPMPRRDDLVTVLANAADEMDVDRLFRVLEVESAGLFGEARRMQCTTWRSDQQWANQ